MYILSPKYTLINERRPKIIHESMTISSSRINFLFFFFSFFLIKTLCSGPRRKIQIHSPNQSYMTSHFYLAYFQLPYSNSLWSKYKWSFIFPPLCKAFPLLNTFVSMSNISDVSWSPCYGKLWINILCLFSFGWSQLFPQSNESWFGPPYQVGHF